MPVVPGPRQISDERPGPSGPGYFSSQTRLEIRRWRASAERKFRRSPRYFPRYRNHLRRRDALTDGKKCGEQHYQRSFLGDEVMESDRVKAQWANENRVPLLILPQHEVARLHVDDQLAARIRQFLGITRPSAS